MKIAVPLNVGLMIALAAVTALAVHGCNAARQAKAEAEAAKKLAAEEAKAKAAGVPVIEQVPDLREFSAKLLAENADLKQALDRAEKAVPGVKVVGGTKIVVEGTIPQSVPGIPRPGTAGPPASGPPGSGVPEPPPPSAGGHCVLSAGDGLRLELNALVLKGPAGGRYLTGTNAAYRKLDGQLLLREPFIASNVEAVEEAPKPPKLPGWAYGLGAGLSERGALGALLVQTPPARMPLLGWPLRGWVVAAGGVNQGLVLGGASVEP